MGRVLEAFDAVVADREGAEDDRFAAPSTVSDRWRRAGLGREPAEDGIASLKLLGFMSSAPIIRWSRRRVKRCSAAR